MADADGSSAAPAQAMNAAAAFVAVRGVLGDGAGSPIDQGVTSLLSIAALFFGWIAFRRLRGRGYLAVPAWLAWGFAALTAACIVLIFVLPPILRPVPAAVRPRSTARIEILSPRSGEVFHGDPARVRVEFRVAGGRIVSFTSTHLTTDEGHVHLFVDRRLVSMLFGSSVQRVFVQPGVHTLVAEFVAVDHGPFNPPVEASVSFRVVP
jgi:hypothetical protein